MSYNNTDNLYLKFLEETYAIAGQYSSVETSSGVLYEQALIVGAKVTKIIFASTDSEGNFTLAFALIRREFLILVQYLTETISTVTGTNLSSKENVKREHKSFFLKSFIAAKLIVLHNKDPPTVF